MPALRVFLSHSTKDADFVGNLAIALEASGFAPWRCEVDIDKGEDLVQQDQRGVGTIRCSALSVVAPKPPIPSGPNRSGHRRSERAK